MKISINKKNFSLNSNRNLRISNQIKKDLSLFINKEIPHKYGFITITDVNLTVDYAYAKIFFTVFGGNSVEETLNILNKKSGIMHSYLYKNFHIHTIPTIEFIYDNSIEYGMKISQLIKEANK
ncbi:Ribosome-binding factor A [Candidatus Kinetoplastibacterium sorsogonicusi]|uniref:Ribosome-binding factor A n=1 Tax=Candidatus Kinetoplastidibacterium kentomonadis TaxID=1576550 RepID=A0A3S7JA28_9PROT|nr:30S ribosome-binding factor RbfA [Candidatus Kinetoplastibacterium sorsogonicusi]AWD32511.1 Ribosome-binding factor A [Candidatus Kinetoplastibacterium sorsogonicusi]